MKSIQTHRGNFLALALICTAVGFLTGCQTYKPPRERWLAGDYAGAAREYGAKATNNRTGKDAIIWNVEYATTLRANGQFKESSAEFDTAEEQINRYDELGKTSISGQTAALFVNQATVPYEGRDYDKVMVNVYKALNFIQLGEADKARVEFIRAAQRQQDAEENNKRRILKLEEAAEKLKDSKEKGAAKAKEMADKAKNDAGFKQKIQASYGYLDEFKAKANYVNPFAYYMDGLFFLTANADRSDLVRARDSFRFTLGSIGENKFIMQDLEMVDQLLQGAAIPPVTYVIFETGTAPLRGQIRIDIPLFLVGVRDVPYVGAAFPILKIQNGHLPSLNVSAGGTNETSVLLASMDNVVGQAFKDELPSIITKTLVSTTLKAAVFYGASQATKKQNPLVDIMVKAIIAVVQASVNIADTRTWNTLPKEIQFCRVTTPADRYLILSGPNGTPKTELVVDDGQVNLIYVKSVSATNSLLVSQIKLK